MLKIKIFKVKKRSVEAGYTVGQVRPSKVSQSVASAVSIVKSGYQKVKSVVRR